MDTDNRLSYDLNEKAIEEGVFGDTLFVNGVATPYLEVANRKYRFRFLAAANRQAFTLGLVGGGPMTIIGIDGGLLEHAEHMMMGQFEVLPPGGFGASATQLNSAFVCPLPTST